MNADKTLGVTTRLWFFTLIAGELFFAFTIASFYGLSAARGELWQWSRRLTHGFESGDTIGNTAIIMHLASAFFILLAGAIQFIPQFRERYPAVHRWTGRFYILSALTLTAGGVFMQWFRPTVGDIWLKIGSTGNAVAIWLCAAMAARYAIKRNFRVHRRWGIRLFLVVSSSIFIRVMLFLSLVLNKGPFGFDPTTFSGPFLTFVAFAQYLLPLTILELYFLAQARPGAVRRFAMAGGMLVLTLVMLAGIASVAAAVWVPTLKAAYDSRKSIAHTMAVTADAHGIDAAIQQYRQLKAAAPAIYNFDEPELNRLGYQLLRKKRFKEAIRVFELNTEVYPRSSNTWDSLGEAYLDQGNRPLAIAHYRKAVQLDPNNRSAATALRKLSAS